VVTELRAVLLVKAAEPIVSVDTVKVVVLNSVVVNVETVV
jgi:hypothetical protein